VEGGKGKLQTSGEWEERNAKSCAEKNRIFETNKAETSQMGPVHTVRLCEKTGGCEDWATSPPGKQQQQSWGEEKDQTIQNRFRTGEKTPASIVNIRAQKDAPPRLGTLH